MASYKDINREIKGYVEVKYNISEETPILSLFYDNGNKTYEINSAEFTTSLQNIYSTSRKPNKYAILEENYTSLDGSFLLFDKVNQDSGFISDKTINEYIEYGDTHGGDNTQICLEIGNQENLIETDINGLTIYAKNNKITSCHVTLFDSEFNIIEEKNITDDNSTLLLIFNNSLKNHFIYIDNITFENPDRRIMIDHIDIGMSYIYEDNELIEFSVIEEVDKLVQKTPANELKVTIGDYDKLYDPLNPTGITKYLTEDAIFISYIGIANDNGKIEYTKMGTFYYDSIDYQEGQVTITSYNLISKIEKLQPRPIYRTKVPNYVVEVGKLQECLENYLNTSYEYSYLINISNKNEMKLDTLDYSSINNILQTLSMLEGIYFIDRDENIVIKEINQSIKEILSKNELTEDAKYSNINNYKNIINTTKYYQGSTSKHNTINVSVTLQKNKQYLAIKVDDKTAFNISNEDISYQNATRVYLDGYGNYNCNQNYIFLVVEGEIGTNVSITIDYYGWSSQNEVEVQRKYYENIESNITISNDAINITTNDTYKLDDFIKKIPTYSLSLNYNGNPNIKAGDYIEVETDYGFIPVFVQKHQLTYDGGLSGSIEGVE
ncbi:MAG: hypothetical protein IJ568_05660 [Bacilli bacterium]|nr:hypothetical protein [Bacilli bacterium]